MGSTSLAANGTTGVLVSEQRYKPWGEQRYPTGSSTLPTRRQFTGQINDTEIGLYFYNARYYSNSLNRWLSPDSIVPDPTNPQSLNRYAYVLGNPLRYTDPTGHRSCDDGPNNCESMRPDDPYANPFEIGFAGNWLADDVDAVLHAASAIARALVSTFQREDWVLSKTEGTVHQRFSAATVFNQIYGGVTFSLSSEWEGDGGAWAFTNNGHLVTVYSAARGKFSYQNAAHEFGHAFARHVINPTIKPPNENRQPYLDVGAANIKYIHPDTKQVITLGTGNNRTNRGYATAGLDWQQNTKASDGEEFADMFLGWAFNHFAGDAAGAARYNWMSTNMADWLTQANQ